LDEPDEAKKNSRIVMLVATKQVMKNCFGMLGIEELEKM
jgi:arginyl-tRNA synthetase